MPKQRILRFCNDRKIRRETVNSFARFATPGRKELKVWLNLREFYQRVKGFTQWGIFSDDQYYLPVDDRDALPISPYPKLTASEQKRLCNPSELAEEAINYEFMQIDKENKEPWFAGATKWVTIVCASVFGFIMFLVVLHRIDPQQILSNFAKLGGGG